MRTTIFILSFLFIFSCASHQHDEKVKEINNIVAEIDSHLFILSSIDTAGIKKISNEINANIEKFQRYNRDTLTFAKSSLLGNYQNAAKPMFQALKEFESLKKQLEFSKKQLEDLSYDLQHEKTDSVQFNKYFLIEKNIATEICEEINMLKQKTVQSEEEYKELHPMVKIMVQSLDTTVSIKFGVGVGNNSEEDKDKD